MNTMNHFASGLLAGRRPIYRPPLTIAQRVIDTIVTNVQRYDTETGEALIGLALPGIVPNTGSGSAANAPGNRSAPEPDLVVLGTIAPDASAVRTGVFFEQGDDLQSDTLNWLSDNWNDARKLRAANHKADSQVDSRWNVPLIHLGDWHKHPGTLVEPSPGDANTAVDLIYDRDIQRPYILAILATIWNKAAAQKAIAELSAAPVQNGMPLLIDLPDDPGAAVRIDCWYLSRQTRIFVRLSPMVQPNTALPTLPIVGWHLTDPKRMWRECNALLNAGYGVQIDERDTDGQPPREICLTVTSPVSQSPQMWIIVTPADYPHHAPIVRRVPTEMIAGLTEPPTFSDLWARSVPLPNLPNWTPDRLLIDLIKA